jgi:hypothetical protein
MTYLELVNHVLTRLREDNVGAVSESSYSRLIGELVNDSKRLVEDAWQWSMLIDWVSYETVQGQYNYSLNNETDALTAVQGESLHKRARFRRNPETGEVLAFINWPVGRESRLYEFAFDRDFDKNAADINAGRQGIPQFVGLQPIIPYVEGKINKNMVLWPTPESTGMIATVYFTNPQNDFDDDNDVMLVPHEPVILHAYLNALYERGEELGERMELISTRARDSLTDAIQHDMTLQGYKALGFSTDHVQS